MSDVSTIEWTDATWNPVTGCTKVSPGCAHCYIERTPPFRIARRRFADVDGASTTGVRLHPERIEQPLHWRKPRRVFVCSLADLFHDDVPDHFIYDVFQTMHRAPQHTFQVLTKRPERLLAWYRSFRSGFIGGVDRFDEDWPLPNVWLGVSIENARYTWRADVLREIPAAIRFISAEPLLGSLYLKGDEHGNVARPEVLQGRERSAPASAVPSASPDLRASLHASTTAEDPMERQRSSRASLDLTEIDWIIAGGESGPGARPFRLEHAREIITMARLERGRRYDAGGHDHAPAVFVKQLGAKPVDASDKLSQGRPLALRDRKGGDWDEWPTDLRIREFPAPVRAVA